jgi:hypothetical protein
MHRDLSLSGRDPAALIELDRTEKATGYKSSLEVCPENQNLHGAGILTGLSV